MRRTGFDYRQIPETCTWLKMNSDHIIFQGLFTHFAGAENLANQFRISNQINNFELTQKMLESENLKPFYHHSTCSAALLNYPATQGNVIRIGILQYGYWLNKETQTRFCGDKSNTPEILKRKIRWTSKVMGIKEVKKVASSDTELPSLLIRI